jgi:hypothetical protein
LDNRFTATIEKESLARFKHSLLEHANNVLCEERKQLEKPQSEEEILNMGNKMRQHHTDLVKTYSDVMIRRARHEITGHDVSLLPEFINEEQRQQAFFSVPTSIQERLNITEEEMKNYQEPLLFIEQIQQALIETWRRWTSETKRLLDEACQKLHEKNDENHHKDQVNQALMVNEPCRTELTPCSEANPHFFENTCDESSINGSIDQILEQRETIKALSDELKEAKQRHELEQQKIEQKFKDNISIMNQGLLLIQQTQQTQQNMIATMNTAMSQTIFSTCMKMTENLYSVVEKLKSHTNNTEFVDILHHIKSQLSYVEEAQKEYCQHHEELKRISNEQNEALNMTLGIFFKNDDV